MRRLRLSRLLAPIAVLALVLAACGGDDPDTDGDTDDAAEGDAELDDVDIPEDGPTITVGSFDFPESTILAEIYATALEETGYPVERELNVGARELLFPELEEGGIDLLPEYLGSALVVGFDEAPPAGVDEGVTTLTEAFEGMGVTVLAPTPAQNSNTFVVTTEFAETNDVTAVGDLAGTGATLAGPPECENRDTCYQGLQDIYGLDDLQFEAIGEGSARLVALTEGDAEVILLFSTDAVLADESLMALEEPEGMIPPENIIPVLRTEIVDAYGDDVVTLLDTIGESLTTEVLIDFNDQANQGTAPDEIARGFLTELGIL
ncbi:MAG: ABC transporter substrate-binding protein [Nitriliruptoraceae bacterium]